MTLTEVDAIQDIFGHVGWWQQCGASHPAWDRSRTARLSVYKGMIVGTCLGCTYVDYAGREDSPRTKRNTVLHDR